MSGAGRKWRPWLVAALLVLGLPAAAAAAPKKPDLLVTALASPAASTTVGEDLPVEVTVQNKGRKASKKAKLGIGLSSTGSLIAPPDIELTALDIPALKPKKKKTITADVVVPADEAPGSSYFLVTCADETSVVKESKENNNCRASTGKTELKRPLTTFELIDAEYEAGTLTLGEAILYKLYAESGDPRLPVRFGTPPEEVLDSSDVVKQAAGSFAGLPAADQAAIEPFFRPPIYEDTASPGKRGQAKRGAAPPCSEGGEAPALNPNWASLETTHFRIHYYTVKPIRPRRSRHARWRLPIRSPRSPSTSTRRRSPSSARR